VDVGGTFTDAVAIGSRGTLRVAKVPSTPEDPSRGLVDALCDLTARGVDASRLSLLSHGTTVATNAVLTGGLARVVLVATEGFRDILAYRSGSRPEIYSLRPRRPADLVERVDRLEVRERLGGRGQVVTPLTSAEVDRIVDEVRRRRPEAVAVALLFSYLDDGHEQMLARALRKELPDTPVTLSAETAREFREYPRTATAALNAGLRPIVGRYLLDARGAVEGLGAPAPLVVMQSNGGCVPAERAEREAHRLILSGPAGGVTGVAALGERLGLDKLISMDMGGTSLDVCLVNDGVAPVVSSQVVGDHPVLAPAVDIATVGAGGGSIAQVDRAGRLRVGPESAGAHPGPAAYGYGGTSATVTDAHVVAGTLGPETPLAGRMTLDLDAAAAAVGSVGDELGMTAAEAARGILAVTLASMSRALRRVSVERGIDPREYTLIAFGGAGPLHAGMLLRDLRLAGVVLPAHPGLFSAAGLVAADLRIDESRTVLQPLDDSVFDDVRSWYRETGETMRSQLVADGIPRSRTRLVASADLRYSGQGYDLNVPLRALSAAGLRALRSGFDALHRSVYGHANPDDDVDLVALRLAAFGRIRRPSPSNVARGRSAPRADALVGERRVAFPSERRPLTVPVLRRERLLARNRIAGPAIIEQMDSTAVLLPGQRARLDDSGDLWIAEGSS
jgi:N-methylhydantoinase A